MMFSRLFALTFPALALSLAVDPRGPAYSGLSARQLVTQEFYASADVRSPNGSIQVLFQFFGTADGQPTFVKIRGTKGLYNEKRADIGGLADGFSYHIHTNPVSADGNCSSTLAHLDPFNVTESLTCGPSFPAYCQEGDLSGKHGKLKGTESGEIAAYGYSDGYLRFFPQDLSILGRSIVIHSVNKTRIACGNITSQLDGTADIFQQPTFQPSLYVKDYPTKAPPNPTPILNIFNGTEFPSNATIDGLPYPLPNPALSLRAAVKVELRNTTRTVKLDGNRVVEIIRPEDFPSDAPGPFEGWMGGSWNPGK